MANADLTADRLRELLHYGPESGEFRWAQDIPCGHKHGRQIKCRAGDLAGYVNTDGYRMIGIAGEEYRAGRLAWLHYYGNFPERSRLAYLDGDTRNNAIANLRERGSDTDLSAGRLRQVVEYDAETGFFTWLRCPSSRALNGKLAGTPDALGYWAMSIDGRKYHGHRLAWLYVTGAWPVGVIDHINGNGLDNRIANLRDVSHKANIQNQRCASAANKSSGLLGAHWLPRDRKWRASITADGKVYHLGRFDSAEDAHAAYLAAKRRLHEGCTI